MTDAARLLGQLREHEVEFILVGGMAATVHGSTRLTQDVDVVYARSPGNLRRLASALRDKRPYPRGAPEGLPFEWSVATLERGLNFTLVTDAGDLDLLGEIAGGSTYEDLLDDAVPIEVFGVTIRCVSLPRLIQLKRAAGRPRDFEAVAELEAILEEREGRAPPGP